MGELIELAESLRWALERLEWMRSIPPGPRWSPGPQAGLAWDRLLKAEEAIRQYDAEITAMQEARANSMGEEG